MSALDLRPDPKEIEKLNSRVLKNIDPDITTLLFSAGHVAVYVFDMEEQKWDHKGVKGPLFVYKRRIKPYYRFAVLNRVQIETLVEQISPDMRLENTDAYLLYKNVEGVINGIWFFERKNKDNFYEFLKGIISKVSINGTEDPHDLEPLTTEPSPLPPPPQPSPTSPSLDLSLNPLNPSSASSPISPYSPPILPSENPKLIPSLKKTSDPATYLHKHGGGGGGGASRMKSSPLLYMHSENPVGDSSMNMRPLLNFLANPPMPDQVQVSLSSAAVVIQSAPPPLPQQPPAPIKSPVALLSKQQFKASLLQLVNNDSFIDSAYSEYIKSFSSND